ncbi:MAG: EAL domain-containing protein [Peptococcaceae bacterium]|nr:EAL domain-containing protein [Peptococcaceae bacterium]
MADVHNQALFVETIIDTIPNPIFYKDADGIYVGCNQAFAAFHGLNKADIIGKSVFELAPMDLAEQYNAADLELLNNPGVQVYETLVRAADGSVKSIVFNKATIQMSDGSVKGLVGVMLDITQRKQVEQDLLEEKERVQVTLNSIGDAVISLATDGKITFLNQIAAALIGCEANEVLGRNLDDLVSFVDKTSDGKLQNQPRTWREEDLINESTRMIRRDGREFAVERSLSAIRKQNGVSTGSVLVIRDISEKNNLLQQIMYQAKYDSLTELPNRYLLNERLNAALAEAKPKNHMVAVMFLDLDGFKLVNDTVGHTIGDILLKGVAKRLGSCLSENDTIGRLGGDEFAILMPNVRDTQAIIEMADKINEALKQPWLFEGHEFVVTASIGISVYPIDGSNGEILMKHADTAMYKVKEQGKNSYVFFSYYMDRKIMERIQMEKSLRHAIKNEEFVVFYQPQVRLSTGKITGVEALVRWKHPKRGLIPPNDFIPLAEETDLIIPLGDQVLRMVCEDVKRWHDDGFPSIRVTINLSAKQFLQKDLLENICSILEEFHLAPNTLELEITESVAMRDVGLTLELLHNLKAMGVGLAIDDFGTGYSSLNYLKRFPISTIKIDKSFIDDVATNLSDAAIVTGIITLAQNLGLTVIAEGVETEAQTSLLRDKRCDVIQGFLFSRPVPVEQFRTIWQENLSPAAPDQSKQQVNTQQPCIMR